MVNTYKTNFVVNMQPATVSLTLEQGVIRNTIFSWTLLQIIKASIKTKKNALDSGKMGEKLELEIMAPPRFKGAPKT